MIIQKYKKSLGYSATVRGVRFAGFTRMEAINKALAFIFK
jgi:hypothetical protein